MGPGYCRILRWHYGDIWFHIIPHNKAKAHYASVNATILQPINNVDSTGIVYDKNNRNEGQLYVLINWHVLVNWPDSAETEVNELESITGSNEMKDA